MLKPLPKTMPSGRIVVLVKAAWCGNCKAYRPVVERAAAALPDVPFFEADVDDRADLAAAWSIDAVPLLVVVRDGTSGTGLVGFQNDRKLSAFLKKNLV